MTTRRAPVRRKSRARAKRAEVWSAVVDRAFDAIDIDACCLSFYDNFRDRIQAHDSEGKGTAVRYTQSVHDVFKEHLGRHSVMFEALTFAIDELLARIDGLEAKLASAPQYRGVWHPEQEYAPGSFVTHRGSVWHADVATKASPGDSSDWTLAVKRGRDGKDTQ